MWLVPALCFTSTEPDVDSDYLPGEPKGRQDHRRQQPERVCERVPAGRCVLQLQVGDTIPRTACVYFSLSFVTVIDQKLPTAKSVIFR